MEENNIVHLHFDVDGNDFSSAGESSSNVKRALKQLGIRPEVIRRVSISMYEGEINMVIHAKGGTADVYISPAEIKIILEDDGPGIPDIDLAMKEGYTTASDSVRELGFGAGMGLPNIKKYSDSFNITSEPGKGTRLEMKIKV